MVRSVKGKRSVQRPSKKATPLDYSYGESPSASGNAGIEIVDGDEDDDEDDLIVGSRTSAVTNRTKQDDLMERVRLREAKRLANSKYLGYNDFASGESESIIAWNRFIGYVLIRIVSPFILIGHCFYLGYYLWKVYEFNFAHSDLTKQYIMPIVVGVICLHSVIVHFINKSLFKSNYYKRRF